VEPYNLNVFDYLNVRESFYKFPNSFCSHIILSSIIIKCWITLKPVLHDVSNTFKRWPHDHSPHRVAVMHMSGDKRLGPMLALERFPPKVGIFDPRQRSIQRWKKVATSTWYTATRCDMCSPPVTSLELMS
jgi:hypothetical protein